MLNLDKTLPLELRAAALALLPMAFAAAGAWIDERTHLGFSNWRSACRASGLRVESLVAFTLDLLPTALIGALFGSVVLHVITAALWFRAGGARMTLAAHGGCLLGMTAGLMLCAVLPSLSLMGLAELSITVVAAALLCRWPARNACAASVRVRTWAHSSPY
jgi:prolipoprotein diacylglyceryltransferase